MQNPLVVKIEYLSKTGVGVALSNSDQVFFVAGTWPGDICEIKIVSPDKNSTKYFHAQLISVIEPSLQRVVPQCLYQGHEENRCGGCPWMIANYSAQLEQKQKHLFFAFEKTGLPTSVIKPIVPAPQTEKYRNRAQFKTDGNVVGYVAEGTKKIVAVKECLILNDHNQNTLKRVVKSLPKADWQIKTNQMWNYFDIDDDMQCDDIVLNKRRPFKQANSLQNQKMKQWLHDTLLTQNKAASVLELFCGDGNFTEVISALGFAQIFAVDVQGISLEKLRRKNLAGVKALSCDLFGREAVVQIKQHCKSPTILVLDPPRLGAKVLAPLLENIKSLQHIFYISCHVDHFTRDAKTLIQHGFSVSTVTPIDLFPHTPHLEILTHFIR